MPSISFSKQFKEITALADKEVGKAALGFHSEITKAWPVLTGYSKNAWQSPKQIDKGEWQVVNDVLYASVLWKGRHVDGGKVYGSEQLPLGGYPILNAIKEKLIKRLKAL